MRSCSETCSRTQVFKQNWPQESMQDAWQKTRRMQMPGKDRFDVEHSTQTFNNLLMAYLVTPAPTWLRTHLSWLFWLFFLQGKKKKKQRDSLVWACSLLITTLFKKKKKITIVLEIWSQDGLHLWYLLLPAGTLFCWILALWFCSPLTWDLVFITFIIASFALSSSVPFLLWFSILFPFLR